ncbi:MAG TPA: FtsX-like permease family protein, partial [Candidatus Hodarchaeales archaeon]|nr:FtsX-like permease family protein [Candidatus Hodarchaeales archaeon]
TFLSVAEQEKIASLIPNAQGVMPELKTQVSVMIGGQFESARELAGIPANFHPAFGSFYNWKSGEKFLIVDYLMGNSTVLISSSLAGRMGIKKDTGLPLILQTEFPSVSINQTSGQPIVTTQRTNLSVEGIYDSNHPGIGASYRGIIMLLSGLQDWSSLQSPVRNRDIVSTFLVALQLDHFSNQIERSYLQQQFDLFDESIPLSSINGTPKKVYSVDSPRLSYFLISDLISTLLSAILNAMGSLIVMTGILLITNVQLMSVEDREFQTGVLRAVGENRRGIFTTVLMETAFQGFLGGIVGLLGGILFGNLVAYYLAGLFGTGSLSVQPVVKQNVVIFAVILGVLIGIVTGLLPAIRASRVNIVEALRSIKVSFQEKSGRNLAFVGIIAIFLGIILFLNNGLIDNDLDYIWTIEGWDSLSEWGNILLATGFLFVGLGTVLSKYIDRTKAINITAMALWLAPTFMFIGAFGQGWVTDFSSGTLQVMIFGLGELMIGSIAFVGTNLGALMRFLRATLIRISGLKGVASIAPALISSHKTRSTLTFAIFAVVMTLNVLVASLVATNFDNTIGRSEQESRGIDLYVAL